MRKAGRTEGSCRKGADHSANKTENTFALVVTVHQEVQLKSFISLSIRELSLHAVKENVTQKPRFAHLHTASKPQTCNEVFYRKILQ